MLAALKDWEEKRGKIKKMGIRGSRLAAIAPFLAGVSVDCLMACCLDDRSGNHFIPGYPGLNYLECKNWLGLICPSSRIRLSPFKKKGMCVLGIHELFLN